MGAYEVRLLLAQEARHFRQIVDDGSGRKRVEEPPAVGHGAETGIQYRKHPAIVVHDLAEVARFLGQE